jgi:hypothetical protein
MEFLGFFTECADFPGGVATINDSETNESVLIYDLDACHARGPTLFDQESTIINQSISSSHPHAHLLE